MLHHDVAPSRLVRAWLVLVWWLARPLLWLPPTALTAAGVVLAALAAVVAPTVPPAALVLVALAALCDGLDGAVAVLADRATVLGARADAVADRIVDGLFAVTLWRLGVPWPVAVAAGVAAVGVDLFRRARHVPTVITVGERPTWTVCTALACLCRTVSASSWPLLTCAAVWLALGVLAAAQIARGPVRA